MRTNITLAAVVSVSLLLSVVVSQSDARDAGPPSSPVTISVVPDRQVVTAGLPCLPAPPLTVAMTNTGDEAVYADTFVRGDGPLTLTRGMFSSYLPAGTEVSAPVAISAPHGAEPGDYDVTVELAQRRPGGESLRVPVEVVAPPEKPPGTNLLLGEQATPSSTYVTSSTEFNPCGGVDGDRTWSTATAWSSANRGQFPSTYTVTLPEPRTMNRVDLYTSTSPATNGLRDWDVVVLAGEEWQTVAQVRGNVELLVSSRFVPVEASAVRIVALASNRDDYSRIAELEAYHE